MEINSSFGVPAQQSGGKVVRVIETLKQLQYSIDRRGPFALYVYEPNSEYHRGKVWFMDKPQYPEEGEITTAEAFKKTVDAMCSGREVRICDGGDMLVFHAKNKKILYGQNFWDEVGQHEIPSVADTIGR